VARLSIIIANYNPDLPVFTDCWNSLKGKGHEVIVMSSKTALSQKFNAGVRAATGDYLLFPNDDAYWISGDLNDLCIPETVTCPTFNDGDTQPKFYTWCVSKEVFLRLDGYDEQYEKASYDDVDFVFKCNEAGIPIINVPTVNFGHPKPGSTVTSLDGQWRGQNAAKFLAKWGRLP
jgi:GT2 family glycosyltransferase